MTKHCFYLAALLLLSITVVAQQRVRIISDTSPQLQFAEGKMRSSLNSKGYAVSGKDEKTPGGQQETYIILGVSENNTTAAVQSSVVAKAASLKPEGFIIQRGIYKGSKAYYVIGKDEAGAMYGGLEMSDLIRVKGIEGITDMSQNPHMGRRGIKMNIPLDARTPSYTDASDAGQKNITEMWSMDFWKAHIDSLASYRYNFISLWSLHPFPSLVKVPEYSEVALNDVHRSTIKWNEYYSTRGTGLDGPDVVDQFEVVKKISIDEKIQFWRQVMRYAKDRNIDFYIVTWNTFTASTKGKYGITDDLKNPVTKDYFRKSVKQLFITYPDLMGIGLTTGENMPGADFEAKENWSFETYGQGVLDVVKEQPNRKITFIHRQHETGALDIARKFAPLIDNKNINFIFSFKYAQAHVYSSTTQTYHPEFVKEIQSSGNLKTLWTLRNDDVYYFRWGAPDFVREFIRNMPEDVSEGFYFGSDQHIWGREFMDKQAPFNRPIELAKHWYQWKLWGRLGYNPDLSNDYFISKLAMNFPGADAQKLFDAWQSASLIYPLTTGFHWGALDFQWYIEGCKSRPEPAQTPSGFHDVNRFINLPPHKGTDFISIPDFVKSEDSGEALEGTTPFEVSDSISQQADQALSLLDGIGRSNKPELARTKEDIKAMAYLGKYYAHKINGATYLALFRSQQNSMDQQSMFKELNLAAYYWRCYASTALAHYINPLWTNRVGYVDWKDLYNYVLKDITDNGGTVKLQDMKPSPGGTIVQAEKVQLDQAEVIASGNSTETYAQARGTGGKIKWSFEATEPGDYLLEVRYRTSGNLVMESALLVDKKTASKVDLWSSGSPTNWVIDRTKIQLQKGKHAMELDLPGNVHLDLVNIIKL